MNVYSTEKAQTYHLHLTFFSLHFASELLGLELEKLQKELVEMSKVYVACRGDWLLPLATGSPSNAHLEICVPLHLAGDILTELPAAVVAASTVSVPTWTWW